MFRKEYAAFSFILNCFEEEIIMRIKIGPELFLFLLGFAVVVLLVAVIVMLLIVLHDQSKRK